MDNQQLFDELILSASKLATVADQASTILSEEFEGLVKPAVDEVRDVLRKCPLPVSQWDGTLREEDIEQTGFESPGLQDQRRFGVNLKHTITGIQRQSYTKPTEEENRAVARKSLEQAIKKRYQSLQK